jgi:signal transduction histidine kinase
MKLLNYTSTYFSIILFIVITAWAAIFYYAILDEIYDSIDDGLDNQKGLVIEKAAMDSSVLQKSGFDETGYAIREVQPDAALAFHDHYSDTMMFMQNEQSDEPVRLLTTVFLKNGKYYQLQVATSMVEEDDLVKQIFYAVTWLYLGLVISIIVFNNFLLKKVWRPFYHLMRQLKKFRVDQPTAVTRVKTNVDEFKLLDDTVQRLIARNVEVFNSQKMFIENAAHELQTPLAISINKLEALSQGNFSGEQFALLSSALDNLERLKNLNKSLLLLSRIENKQFADETSVNCNELIKKLLADFEDQADFRSVKLEFEEDAICFLPMNKDLALILFTNLVKNAILHSEEGGFVKVLINQERIIFENSGKQEALDPSRLFQRFNNDKSSRASTGLGLAIVRAICDMYHFDLNYQYTGRHIFSIRYPEP